MLVTNGWVRTAYNVVESLGRRGIPVHVVDRSKHAMCRYSRWAKSYHPVPNFFEEPEAYVRTVAGVARKVEARVLIPVLEDIITLAAFEDALPKGLGFAHAPVETLRAANDKWEVMKLCGRLGVPCAESFVPESLEELRGRASDVEYPAVIKTRLGNAGKGVAIVSNGNELVSEYREIVARFSIPAEKQPMVQEYLGSDVSGVCMIYDRGRLIAATAETYLRCKEGNRFSTSVFRQSDHDPEAVENCRKVADALAWHGVIHFDLIRDSRTGVRKITEINPRFWGGAERSHRRRCGFPLYALRAGVDREDLGSAADLPGRRLRALGPRRAHRNIEPGQEKSPPGGEAPRIRRDRALALEGDDRRPEAIRPAALPDGNVRLFPSLPRNPLLESRRRGDGRLGRPSRPPLFSHF